MRMLQHFFARQVERTPNAIAVDAPCVIPRAQLTYTALAQKSAGIAEKLLELPAAASVCGRPDPIVAILLSRQECDLYAAQIGALLAGAAWTAIDPSFPDEHIRRILDDAQPLAVVTDAQGVDRLGRSSIACCTVIDVKSVESTTIERALALLQRGGDPHQLAYLIYTSGTTGLPKGVMIEHQSIVALVESDCTEFALTSRDRVAQCSSAAYDSSIEETWLAFASGATLVPLDDSTLRSGPDLIPFLRDERVTVFCPPPTLLRSMGCQSPKVDLPDLRLLYVGGETLPQDLSDQWSAVLHLENGYGPTECTVTVVRGRMNPGVSVHIGRAVPGSMTHILHEDGTPVLAGDSGELCISGASLARGYRGDDPSGNGRFFDHPTLGRLYRTGDLARSRLDGDIECLGRIDGQVKLRGYRVELPAVEAACAAVECVQEAGCRLQGEGPRTRLAAFLVRSSRSQEAHIETVRAHVRSVLPGYMVPTHFEWIDRLPTTTGGKIDRRNLPDRAIENPVGTIPSGSGPLVAFARVLSCETPPTLDDDFFLDLGGDSLTATAAVVAMRTDPAWQWVATTHIYQWRTARELERVATQRMHEVSDRVAPEESKKTRTDYLPQASPIWTTIAQAFWLGGEIAAVALVAVPLLFLVIPWLIEGVGLSRVLILAAPLMMVLSFLWLGLTVAATRVTKALLVGRLTPQSIPVWSSLWLRHWIVSQVAQLIPWRLCAGTVLQSTVLRALGARVGEAVSIHPGVALHSPCWELLCIKDRACIAQDALLQLARLEGGCLIIDSVSIGSDCAIQTRATIGGGTSVGNGSVIAPLAYLSHGTSTGSNERWSGVPAKCTEAVHSRVVAQTTNTPTKHVVRVLFSRLLGSWIGLIVVGLFLRHTAFGFEVAEAIESWLLIPSISWESVLFVALSVAGLVVIRLSLLAAQCRMMGVCRPGEYDLWGSDAARALHKPAIVDSAGQWLAGTVFWPIWLRLAGMRIGKQCEISTILDTIPELISMGDRTFFADGVYFACATAQSGRLTLQRTDLSRKTFVGNHAVIPSGASYPEGMFIGVGTAPPNPSGWDSTQSFAWFGQPPLQLPNRAVQTIDERLTYSPSPLRWARRVFFELARFALPILPLALLLWWYTTVINNGVSGGWIDRGVLSTLALAMAVAVLIGSAVALKWILLGRVKANQHAFWSGWCCRWDLHYCAWEMWARPLAERLQNTLLLNMILRSTGMRIGRGVVLGDGFAQVIDTDMLQFEDHSTIACHFQAHSFEDRVLKIEPLIIRKGASVGENTVVFYGADIGEGCHVAPGGIVMKRDRLPSGTSVGGSPAIILYNSYALKHR